MNISYRIVELKKRTVRPYVERIGYTDGGAIKGICEGLRKRVELKERGNISCLSWFLYWVFGLVFCLLRGRE